VAGKPEAASDKRRNILFLHHTADWYGADKILFNVLELLSHHHNCYVVLPYSGVLKEKIARLSVEYFIFPFPVFRKKYLRINGPLLLIGDFLASFPKLARLLITKRIDIVYSNTLSIAIGALLAMLFRKKHCWHIHEILERPRIFRLFMHWCCGHLSNLNICVSNAVARNIGDLPSVRVVHNGIDPVIGKPVFARKHASHFQTAVFGRFNSWKGQLHAVKAVEYANARVDKGNGPAKLLLAGSYFENQRWWLDDVVRYVRERQLGQWVEIRDFTEEIGALYEMTDLFLVPSTLPDPFPTVALEAMSAGVPVVGYRQGGLREMLADDPECLAQPNDPADLGERIRFFATHENERQAKARAQYDRFLGEFTKQAFNRRFLDAFSTVTNPGGSG
jgi:glycosyltransferase involved in cell wall biosynthesis